MTFQQPPTVIEYPKAIPYQSLGEVDLCLVNSAVTFDISGLDVLTVQIDRAGVAWATNAVVTMQVSNDGRSWYAVPSGAVTFAAVGISARYDIGGYRFARFITTTVGTGTSPYMVSICLYGRARPIVGTI